MNATDPDGQRVISAVRVVSRVAKGHTPQRIVGNIVEDAAYDWHQLDDNSGASFGQKIGSSIDLLFGTSLNDARGDALGDRGRLEQDSKGKVHGNLPDADDVPDDGVEDSIGALEGSIGVRKEEQKRFPPGDPNGSPRERREARQRQNHEERIRREQNLLDRLRERNQ